VIGLFCVGNRAVNVVVSFICVVHTERFKLGFAACATGVLGFDKAPSLDTPPDGWHAFPALTFSAAPTSDACQLTTTTIEDEPPRSTDGSSLCDPGSSGVAFMHLCFALSFQRRGVSFAVTEHYPTITAPPLLTWAWRHPLLFKSHQTESSTRWWRHFATAMPH